MGGSLGRSTKQQMANPLIAIIGSADEKRSYDPPMQSHARARKAAEMLGQSLAERGFRLVVYQTSPDFIEGEAVRGFLRVGGIKPRSIILESPLGSEGVKGVPQHRTHSYVFEEHRDASKSWEVSFYRSLSQVDGVALIGGGQSTLVAGVVALTRDIPLIALPAFGGKAQEIWQWLRQGTGLATENAAIAMAASDPETAVPAAVRSLEEQEKERKRRRRMKSESRTKLGATALLLAWPLLLVVGAIIRPPQTTPSTDVPGIFWGLLSVGPLIAGASGATIRALDPKSEGVTAASVLRGTAAGLVCGIFYLIAQLSALAANGMVTFLTLLIELATAFVGGFTADRILSELAELRVLKERPLEPVNKEQGPAQPG
jgi:hypothetical protein